MLAAIERLRQECVGTANKVDVVLPTIQTQDQTPIWQCLTNFDKAWQALNQRTMAAVKVKIDCEEWNQIPDLGLTTLPNGIITDGKTTGIQSGGTLSVDGGTYIFYSVGGQLYLRTKLGEKAFKRMFKENCEVRSMAFEIISEKGKKK